MRRIELYRSDGMWVARAYGREAESLLDLFGVDTLPTPYRDTTPAAVVLAALESLNPDTVYSIA